MKLKKVASVFMAVVLSVGLLAGCGKKGLSQIIYD